MNIETESSIMPVPLSSSTQSFNIIFTKEVYNEYVTVFFCHQTESFSIAIAHTQTRIDILTHLHDKFTLFQSIEYYFPIDSILPISIGETSELAIIFKQNQVLVVSYQVGQHSFKTLFMFNPIAVLKNPFRLGTCRHTTSLLRSNESPFISSKFILFN